MAALVSAFGREGLDPLRPYLGPGPDAGDGPEPLSATRAVPGSIETHRLGDRSDGTGPAVVASTDPFGAAVRIGTALCRSACWDTVGRSCNWIGRSAAEVAGPGGMIAPISEALGHDLYSGSAGIALFLAELHALTGDEQHRRTARGAIARSLRRHAIRADEDAPTRLSFFVGALGLAYVAWRVSVLIEDPELRSEVDPIVARLGPALSVPHGLDVIGGDAGAIPPLLAMGRTRGLEACRELAILLGEELCRLDLSSPGSPLVGFHRDSGSGLQGPLPSGFSHGAAGIGLALFELHDETGESAFRDAARRAFEHEDRLFDPDRRNWADRRRASGPSVYELAWCNGAPGIALARLRAAALDPDRKEHYLDMVRIAIATTLGAIEMNLAIPRYDATPCHGLGGLIEIAWIAGRALEEQACRGRAVEAARVLIDRYATSGDWPSGLYSGGPNPSLMIGTAGIGYTFLRLHDPDRVPSVLWIGC
jgi:lantibiotic modifying enzyme